MSEFSKKIGVISGDGDLDFILTKVKHLQTLNMRFQSFLDPKLQKHVQVANLSNKTLILLVTNGTIATQIRYDSRMLLAKCARDEKLKTVQKIECKIRPDTNTKTRLDTPSPRRPVAPLSRDASNAISAIAEGIEDKDLKAALETLASRFK